MNSFIKTGFFFIVIAGLFLVASSCNKKKDTIAKVYVRDYNNQPVGAVEVTLVGEETIEHHNAFAPNKTSSTNRSGEAIFNYNDVFKSGQAGVAVMKIEVEVNGVIHTGIIKIDQETTSEETILVPA